MNTRNAHIRKLVKKILLDSKISSPPISEKIIADCLGMQIIHYPFPEEISAVLIKDKGLLAIGVNQAHHPNRQRFSIAHEIGHYELNHGEDLFVELSEVDFVAERNSHVNQNLEKEANHFASELLMPLDMLKNDLKEQKDTKILAKRYQVSEQAMLLRLINSNLV